MNRRKFLKQLGIGTAVAVAAPVVATELLKEEPYGIKVAKEIEWEWRMAGAEIRPEWTETYGGDDIVWDASGKHWMRKSEIQRRLQFEREMEMKLFEKWGNETISSFCAKTGKCV